MIGLACVLPLLVGTVLLGGGTELSARTATRTGVVGALATLVLLVVAWSTQAVVDIPWLPSLGLRIHLGLDGISGPLAVLAAAVTAAACLTTWGERPRSGSQATFVGCLLITLAGAVATFAARDALLFVVAFELVLVPMWVLITRFGDERDPQARREAGARFVLYTGLGSTLMLLGVLLLVSSAGTADLQALGAARGEGLSAATQVTIAVLLTLGLAVKVPVWPLHSWLPLAHTTAPTAGSMLLAAVLLKMGTYGLVRLPLATVPDGFATIAPVLAVCGSIGIIWGGLVCLVETDLKRLIAWSSIAHMGFVALALATGSDTGVAAALYANIAHGVISALLFLVVGGLKHQWGDDDLRTPRAALREGAPVTGLLLLVGLAAGLGLPGLAGFWGEFTAVIAALSPAADRSGPLFVGCAVAAAVGAALAAGYSLRVARLVWLGEDHPGGDAAPAAELRRTDLLAGALLALAVLVLGVVPGLLLAVTDPALVGVVTR
ncbi:complex I subunit 4 family protein [Janibacter limosus]|uniref:NADH-quinone oxidoreductase subunit M n=1 Tax=Janibacter limosus TaxID=53458 RepID=A0A4P6MTM3_9MICO|nr:NADH-quinone oxidoreductase subunit M [Janibacter limosus]QBF46994.1 NADH-quinone oxidoreductase subunit M [Janibacter limosus]